jgi:hypothetical protein
MTFPLKVLSVQQTGSTLQSVQQTGSTLQSVQQTGSTLQSVQQTGSTLQSVQQTGSNLLSVLNQSADALDVRCTGDMHTGESSDCTSTQDHRISFDSVTEAVPCSSTAASHNQSEQNDARVAQGSSLLCATYRTSTVEIPAGGKCYIPRTVARNKRFDVRRQNSV